MNPIEGLAPERACSERTRTDVQRHTAQHTIEAARRAVKEGTAGDFEWDVLLTLAEVQAREFGGGKMRELRAQAQKQLEQWRAEDAQQKGDEDLRRRSEARPEVEATAGEFLARFAPASQEKQ